MDSRLLRVPHSPTPQNDILTHFKVKRIEMKKDYRSENDFPFV
jgi:hypothetical protein